MYICGDLQSHSVLHRKNVVANGYRVHMSASSKNRSANANSAAANNTKLARLMLVCSGPPGFEFLMAPVEHIS
jgi:hypothetical protein